MKIKKVGITAAAIAISVGVLGVTAINTQVKNGQRNIFDVFATTEGVSSDISIDQGELAKLNYNYGTKTTVNKQTEAMDLDIIYVMDDSGSRTGVLQSAYSRLRGFLDKVDKTRNSFGTISYSSGFMSEEQFKSSISAYPDYLYVVENGNMDLSGVYDEKNIFFFNITPDQNHIPDALRRVASKLTRQKVLVFESDFQDFGFSGDPGDGTNELGTFLNKATADELRSSGYKVILVGDAVKETSLTEIEKDFSYRIASSVPRDDILNMFIQTNTTETHSSPNTQYEVSLRGTSYKFAPSFLDKIKADKNYVVEGEDYFRLKVPEFNAEIAKGNKPADVPVSFSSLAVQYRDNTVAPAEVEHITVSKDGQKEQIPLTFTPPVSQEQTVYVGEDIVLEDFIQNLDTLPQGITFELKEEVDNTVAGTFEIVLVAKYPDGLTLEVPTTLNILPKFNVVAKYLDENGKEIAPSKILFEENQKDGTEYEAEQISITGYTFSKMHADSAPAKGVIEDKDLEVIFVYTKNPEPVVEAPHTGLQTSSLAGIVATLSALLTATGLFLKKK